MSWREELRQTPLSFRGVRIIWNNTSESGGYNNDKKIYPSMGGWDIEQISQIPESFSIEGKLLGEDYLDKKNKLRSALQTPGPGPLVIPGLGTVQVLVAKWSIKEKVDAKGMAEVSMSFDKAQPEKIKFVQVDPAVVITDHSPVLAENLTGYMESRMNYDSASLLLEARRATAAVFDEILTAAAMLQGQTGPLAKVLNTIKNARDKADTLAAIPLSLISSLFGISNLLGSLIKTGKSFENLYAAWKKAFKGTKTFQAHEYSFHLDRRLQHLQEKLGNGSYSPGSYRYFFITDPKLHRISVASFEDRIVHHALINILEPVYEPCFFHHSYATRKNKGSHRAIRQAQIYLGRKPWYLKMDIAKYFDSIIHGILYSLLERKIKDDFILELCKKIMAKGGDGTKGLPIGNLPSQFWANVYLNPFDHFVKDELAIPFYLRYMDDFVLFSKDRESLKRLRPVIENFLRDKLMLRTKARATMINSALHGLPFLGMRIFPSIIRVRQENFKRSFARLMRREEEYRQGFIDYEGYSARVMNILDHLMHKNSLELKKKR